MSAGLNPQLIPFMFRILLCLSLPALGLAAELPLSSIAARVRSHHPMLKAARLTIEEARGRQLGSGRLANPTLETSFQNESRVSPRTTVFAIDQSFPITKRLHLEKQLTSQLVTAAELEVRDVERRLIAEARGHAIKIVALEKQRALRQQQTANSLKSSPNSPKAARTKGNSRHSMPRRPRWMRSASCSKPAASKRRSSACSEP
jgi:hypothetical protein